MSGFSCWFCGEGIDESDTAAVLISASGLWASGDDAPVQEFFSHSTCAVRRLKGATMKFELGVFFDLD